MVSLLVLQRSSERILALADLGWVGDTVRVIKVILTGLSSEVNGIKFLVQTIVVLVLDVFHDELS